MADFQALAKNIGGIGSALGGMAQKQLDFKDQLGLMKVKNKLELDNKIMMAKATQKMKQDGVLGKIEQMASVGKNLQAIGLDFSDLGITKEDVFGLVGISGRGTPQSTKQPTTPQISPVQQQPIGRFNQFPRQPQGQRPRNTNELLVQSLKPGMFGGLQIEKAKPARTVRQEKIIGKAVDVSAKGLEEILKSTKNFSRVEAALTGLISQGKRAVQEFGGFDAQAIVSGKVRSKLQDLGLEKAPVEEQFSGLAGFEGQLQELILALSPILTNQNRVLRGVLQMLKKTVPDFPLTGTTEAKFTAKTRQTAKNAFRLSMAMAKGFLSVEEIERLQNSASDKEIVEAIQRQVNKTSFSPEDEKFFETVWGRIKSSPAAVPEALFAPGEFQPVQRGGLGQLNGQFKQPSKQIDINNVTEADLPNLSDAQLQQLIGR